MDRSPYGSLFLPPLSSIAHHNLFLFQQWSLAFYPTQQRRLLLITVQSSATSSSIACWPGALGVGGEPIDGDTKSGMMLLMVLLILMRGVLFIKFFMRIGAFRTLHQNQKLPVYAYFEEDMHDGLGSSIVVPPRDKKNGKPRNRNVKR